MNTIELDEKLIIAKLNDKIKACKKNNKVVYTDFLNLYKRDIIQKELNRLKESNYLFYGGYDDAEYQILILYPEKLSTEFEKFSKGIKKDYGLTIAEKYVDNIIKLIRITLPKELIGQYEHRNYLSAVMRFGLTRERIGDIIVHSDGADIIVLKENSEYLRDSLKELTRFKKSDIKIININGLRQKENKFQDIKISISSNRLDNYVSEITKYSRSKTEKIIKEERVKINSKIETKPSKEINIKDEIVIRGYGKFIVDEFLGVNKKEKNVVLIKKIII